MYSTVAIPLSIQHLTLADDGSRLFLGDMPGSTGMGNVTAYPFATARFGFFVFAFFDGDRMRHDTIDNCLYTFIPILVLDVLVVLVIPSVFNIPF
jgi:hypothetical protein